MRFFDFFHFSSLFSPYNARTVLNICVYIIKVGDGFLFVPIMITSPTFFYNLKMIGTILIMIGSTTIQLGRVHVDMREFDTKEGMDNLLEYLFGDNDNDNTSVQETSGTIQDNNEQDLFESYDNSVKKDPIVHQIIENDNKVDIDNGFMSDKYDEPVKTIYDHINDVTSVNDDSVTVQDNVDFSLVSFSPNSPKRCELDDLFDELKDNNIPNKEVGYNIVERFNEDTSSTLEDDYYIESENRMRNFVNKTIELLSVQKNKNRKKDHLKAKAKMYAEIEASSITWEDVDYVKSIEDISRIYGRKHKILIEQLNNLIGYIKDYTRDFKQCSVSLPQKKKELQVALKVKSQRLVCNVLKNAVKVGLLKKCKKAPVLFEKIAHYYVYNPNKISEIRELNYILERGYNIVERFKLGSVEKDNKIPNKERGYNIVERFKYETEMPIEVRKKVRFRQSLSGIQDKKYTDEQYILALHENYPLKKLEEINEENNRMIEEMFADVGAGKFLCKFTPTITRGKSGFVSKIGIRATNSISNIPKEDIDFCRDDLMTYTFGNTKIYDFDVKSSIYRLTYFLNRGEWPDNNKDFYQEMSPYKFRDNTDDRDNFKMFCMKLYFAKTDDEVITRLSRKVNGLDDNGGYGYSVSMYGNVSNMYDKMRDVIGKSYMSEIFLHESGIYMLLMNRLLKAGYKVVQVYDGFYCDEPIDEFCRANIEECANEYFNNYFRTAV